MAFEIYFNYYAQTGTYKYDVYEYKYTIVEK